MDIFKLLMTRINLGYAYENSEKKLTHPTGGLTQTADSQLHSEDYQYILDKNNMIIRMINILFSI